MRCAQTKTNQEQIVNAGARKGQFRDCRHANEDRHGGVRYPTVTVNAISKAPTRKGLGYDLRSSRHVENKRCGD